MRDQTVARAARQVRAAQASRAPSSASQEPTHFVDVSAHFEASVSSLEAHEAYNSALPETFPNPRELLGGILGQGGQAAGVEYAVVLEVIDRR